MHPRAHRVTGEAPAVRLAAEAGLLGPLPRARFDTARHDSRVVSAPLPLRRGGPGRLLGPAERVGATVEIRSPVDAGIVEIRCAGELVAVHRLVGPGQGPVWDPLHRAAAEAIALAPHRRHLQVVPPPVEPSRPAD